MARGEYKLRGISFIEVPAQGVTTPRWEELIELNKAAVKTEYQDRPDFLVFPEVQAAMGAEGVEAYRHGRVHPNDLVGTSYRPHQQFRKPFFVFGVEDDRIVSVVYGADNASGNSIRAIERKMNSPFPHKRWGWLGWVATHPDHQGRGLATVGITAAISHFELVQPVSAYAWPGEGIHRPLTRNGLTAQSNAESFDGGSVPLQLYTGRVIKSLITALGEPSRAEALLLSDKTEVARF